MELKNIIIITAISLRIGSGRGEDEKRLETNQSRTSHTRHLTLDHADILSYLLPMFVLLVD